MRLTTNERDAIFQEEQTRFEGFTDELALLSKKYGVALDICGGVFITSPADIEKIDRVEYTNDSSSGDLQSTIITKDGSVL